MFSLIYQEVSELMIVRTNNRKYDNLLYKRDNIQIEINIKLLGMITLKTGV